jgi:hypothetical protein
METKKRGVRWNNKDRKKCDDVRIGIRLITEEIHAGTFPRFYMVRFLDLEKQDRYWYDAVTREFEGEPPQDWLALVKEMRELLEPFAQALTWPTYKADA